MSTTEAPEHDVDVDVDPTEPVRKHRPRWKVATAVLALVCAAAMAATGGYMLLQHQQLQQEARERAEFAAAARQVVVTLMSIDFTNPEDAVRQILDNSADPFRAEFQSAAEDFVKVSRDAKVSTTATVNAVAVQEADAERAVVLVTASTTVADEKGAREAPQNWRLAVDLERDGDRITMSKVEFVP